LDTAAEARAWRAGVFLKFRRGPAEASPFFLLVALDELARSARVIRSGSIPVEFVEVSMVRSGAALAGLASFSACLRF
jgi:hypothetical protein